MNVAPLDKHVKQGSVRRAPIPWIWGAMDQNRSITGQTHLLLTPPPGHGLTSGGSPVSDSPSGTHAVWLGSLIKIIVSRCCVSSFSEKDVWFFRLLRKQTLGFHWRNTRVRICSNVNTDKEKSLPLKGFIILNVWREKHFLPNDKCHVSLHNPPACPVYITVKQQPELHITNQAIISLATAQHRLKAAVKNETWCQIPARAKIPCQCS